MTCRILFVDDEPHMLSSLRRMLFPLQDRWEMLFASSGKEALQLLEAQAVDVVVSDLKMPGIDGVELLETLRATHPDTARIILSGYSDKRRLLKTVGPAHQFLSKPSSPEAIQSAVERVLALKDIFLNDEIRRVVSGLASLPVLPSTYDELVRIADSRDGSLEEAGRLVSKDMGLAASVLKLVNTSFFGLPLHISDPAKAVSLLGLDILKSLIVANELFTKFNSSRYPEFTLANLWKHSHRTAVFAKTICSSEGTEKKTAEHAYIAGLLHDIGKLILAENFEEHYRAIIRLAQEKNIPILEAERETIKVSHAEIGAYIMGLWGFAEPMVRGVLHHHLPENAPDSILVTAVHAANSLEHELVVYNKDYAPHPADMSHLEQIGMHLRYADWREECQKLDENP